MTTRRKSSVILQHVVHCAIIADMKDQLLNASAAARALGVHRSTVIRRVARGELMPIAYSGGSPLFTVEDVEAHRRGERPIPEVCEVAK